MREKQQPISKGSNSSNDRHWSTQELPEVHNFTVLRATGSYPCPSTACAPGYAGPASASIVQEKLPSGSSGGYRHMQRQRWHWPLHLPFVSSRQAQRPACRLLKRPLNATTYTCEPPLWLPCGVIAGAVPLSCEARIASRRTIVSGIQPYRGRVCGDGSRGAGDMRCRKCVGGITMTSPLANYGRHGDHASVPSRLVRLSSDRDSNAPDSSDRLWRIRVNDRALAGGIARARHPVTGIVSCRGVEGGRWVETMPHRQGVHIVREGRRFVRCTPSVHTSAVPIQCVHRR
jgi:hypothetical protein